MHAQSMVSEKGKYVLPPRLLKPCKYQKLLSYLVHFVPSRTPIFYENRDKGKIFNLNEFISYRLCIRTVRNIILDK